jgi:septal ring factor EnvC (AmiA/AmiB activator)
MGRAGATILGLFLSIGGGQMVATQVAPSTNTEYIAIYGGIAATLGAVISAFITAYFTHRSKRAEAEEALRAADHDYLKNRLAGLEKHMEEYQNREVEWSKERETLRVEIKSQEMQIKSQDTQLKAQEAEIVELREKVRKLEDATQGGGLVIR